jgi:hypothetical protein
LSNATDEDVGFLEPSAAETGRATHRTCGFPGNARVAHDGFGGRVDSGRRHLAEAQATARPRPNIHPSRRCGGQLTRYQTPGVDAGVITRGFLLYYIVALWLAARIADRVCHRATGIERTTAAKESLLHLLMLAEITLLVLAGLFLEITPRFWD